jgi:hypothetical protein
MAKSNNGLQQWVRLAPKPRKLTGEDKWNVFLSYRSVNRTWVLNLYDVLRGLGHEVFLDQVVLPGGSLLIRSLEGALAASQSGILIWTSATQDSEWVRREYEVLERQASEKPGFRFVPVRLDNSRLPPFASSRIFLDFSSYPDGPNGGELLRLVHAIVGQPLSTKALHFANDQDEAAMVASASIGTSIKNKRPKRLIQLWNENGLPWRTSSVLGCKVAEGLTRLDQNEKAIRILVELENRFPRAIRPKQLRALALARRGKPGDLDKAQEILGLLYEQGERDPETLGIYARTWMDRYEASRDLSDLERSRDHYADAFARAPDDYYTGINAAAKSVFLGTPKDLKRAAQYAQQVQKIVGTKSHPDDYWKTATVGEAFLIQRKYKDAARLYASAVATARSEEGSHRATWKQARRLMAKLQPTKQEREMIGKAFQHLKD